MPLYCYNFVDNLLGIGCIDYIHHIAVAAVEAGTVGTVGSHLVEQKIERHLDCSSFVVAVVVAVAVAWIDLHSKMHWP